MGDPPDRALYQKFPMQGQARAQVWAYSPRYRRPRHFHAEPEINLIVAGSAVFGVGDCLVEASAGEMLAFPPGQDHVMLHGSSDLTLYAIGIDPALSFEILRLEQWSVVTPLHIRPPVEEFRKLVVQTSGIAQRHDADQDIAEIWERAHFNHPSHSSATNSTLHILTRRTLQSIAGAPELGRTALARQTRAHPSEISRHFHRDVGMTLVRYRTRLRLLKFIRLVDARAGNWTASAVAAGFGSYSQCHRCFQAEFACAPREFFLTDLRQRMEEAFEPSSDQ